MANIMHRNTMDHRKPHAGSNQYAQKRKHDPRPHHGPPAKKARQDDGQYQKSYTTSAEIPLPIIPPKLPEISTEYEKIVFTHPGATTKGSTRLNMSNYDRLEFLGDAYIEIIASRLIFDNYPTTNAGGMCRLRESVVKNETLCKYSIMYGFDQKLNLQDAPNDGIKGWKKIYGDVFEAYAAAVVESDPKHGYARLDTWLRELWAPVLRGVQEQLPDQELKVKEELARKVVCPDVKLNYVEERKPVSHMGQGRETYYMGVYLNGWGWKNQHLGSGEGNSKVIAGQEAAKYALRNHPLIDEIAAKKQAFLAERAAANEAKAAEKGN